MEASSEPRVRRFRRHPTVRVARPFPITPSTRSTVDQRHASRYERRSQLDNLSFCKAQVEG